MDFGETITRAALGSSANLGDLYDARRDDFPRISSFKKSIPKSALNIMDSPSTDIHLSLTDKFSEKFSKLDVSAQLSASVLAGLTRLSGTGKYLSDKMTSARTLKSSLIYNIKTKEESLNVYHEDLLDAFAADALKNGMGTHVVVGISWGANCIASCSYKNLQNKPVAEIHGSLSTQLGKLVKSIGGGGGIDINQGDISNDVNFEIRLFGDMLSEKEELPTSFKKAMKLMKQLPSLIEKSNGGRGTPLTYKLLPIGVLQTYLNPNMTETIYRSMEEGSLTQIVQLFDEMTVVQQRLNDLYQDVITFKSCMHSSHILEITELRDNLSTAETNLRFELADTLKKVRHLEAEPYQLEHLITRFQSNDISPKNVAKTLETYTTVMEKINLLRSLVQQGVTIIGQGVTPAEKILKNIEATSIVLYFSMQSKCNDIDRWNANLELFSRKLEEQDANYQAYVVDCDVNPTRRTPDYSSYIQVMQGCAVVIHDLLTDQQASKNIPWAQAISGTQKVIHKPNKRVSLKIQCTGTQCNPATVFEWTCRKCLTVFDYGFDEHVYCICGMTSILRLEFKCTDPQHGLTFEKHQPDFLRQLIKNLRPFKELNILILGETGVGKSTWINSFRNHLNYDSLEDAENGDLLNLIPTHFTCYDENFRPIKVCTGTDENEITRIGQSATQTSKVYQFNVGDTSIRLIDTPGIGDTQGIDQDKKNFENILGTISYLDEIHGICILMKPNNARLTVMFQFCIKELLTYLHRDASRNIVFCFTNSRGTFYRPGDTLPALQSLLAKNKDVEIAVARDTVYCYDSESYRFLAAVKNNPPVWFSKDEKANFAKSWEWSFTETTRMLKHIIDLPPHKIQSTLNLNYARKLIIKLSRPLAEISHKNETNKNILKDEMREIQNANEGIDELKNRVMVTRTEIEVTRIDHPKTVCSKGACAQQFGIKDDKTTTRYVSICHKRCYIKGVTEDCIGHPGLIDCKAMYNGICMHKNCGHSYRDHLHVMYDSVQVSKLVEDQSIKEILQQKLDAAELKKQIIDTKNKEVDEYENEMKQIREASARFAYFLKTNAITPYNDGLEQYLEYLIDQEKEKVNQGGRGAILQNLVESKASYIETKRILEQQMDEAIDQGGEPMSPTEVDELVKKLQGLKHSGTNLKQALECLEYTQQILYKETVIHPSSSATSYKNKNPGTLGRMWKKLKQMFFSSVDPYNDYYFTDDDDIDNSNPVAITPGSGNDQLEKKRHERMAPIHAKECSTSLNTNKRISKINKLTEVASNIKGRSHHANQQSHMDRLAATNPPAKKELIHKCRICGKIFSNGSNLLKHQKVHQNAQIKPFQCNICGKSFAGEYILRNHTRVDHQNRPIASTNNMMKQNRKSNKPPGKNRNGKH